MKNFVFAAFVAFVLSLTSLATAEEMGCIELEQPGGIRYAAFSPDGKLVATGASEEGEKAATIIWERSTGKKLHTLQQHESGGESINSVTFSPDGKKVATTDRNYRSLIIWDVATGNKEQTIKDENGYFHSNIAFSPNGKLLLASSTIWSIEKGMMLKKFDNVGEGARFSPDGKTLLGGGMVIDIATGNVAYKIAERVLAFSLDGTRVYEKRMNGRSGSKTVCDTKTGKLLASGEDAIAMGRRAGIIPSYASQLDATFFGKNYEFFVEGNTYDMIGCYDIQTGNPIYAFHPFAATERGWNSYMKYRFYEFASYDEKNLPKPEYFGDAENFYFAETTLGELLVLTKFRLDNKESYGAAFIKDGKTPGKTIPLEDIRGSFCVSPDGNYLWREREGNDRRDKGFEVYDLRAGKSIGKVLSKELSGFATSEDCIFSPDGESFMISVNGKVQIWTIKSVAAASKKRDAQQQNADELLRELL